MERRLTFEVIMHDDGNVHIRTINEGNFNLMEQYGIIEFCRTAITNDHNKRVEEQKKPRKKAKH